MVAVGLIWLTKWVLDPLIIHESPFLLFILAVLASSYYGPRGAGILATLLATIISDYFFLSPYDFFITSDMGQGIQLGLFFLEGIIACLVVAKLKRMRQQAESSRLEILRQQEQMQDLNYSLDQRVTERTEKLTELNHKLGRVIQEQVITEKALRQSEERLQLALEASGDGLWDLNIETGEIYLSPQWQQMLGYNPGELPGHINTWSRLIYPEDSGWVIKRLNTHLADPTVPYDFSYRMLSKWGDWKWIANYGKVVEHNTQGQPSRMVGIHRDIHERKQIEQALQESEARYRAVVEDQTELICRFQSDGTLIFANDAYCRYFQKEPQELIGQVFLPLIPLEDQAMVSQNLATLSPAQPILTHEHRVILPTGEIRWQQWTNRAFFDKEGVPSVFQAVGRDITEKKNIELQIAESLQEKEVLLKEVHHRVKNNLQVICSLLNLQARSLHNPEVQAQLKDSHNRIRSMALVHEKLYQSPSFNKINFAGYLKDLTHQLLRAFGSQSSQITVDIEIDPTIDLTIDQAVPCGLILQELISNTLKYAFNCMAVGEERISMQASISSNQLRLIYQDNGKGFAPGFDLHNSSTLGLQLVADLVEQLHGSLEIKNASGAKFLIIFPW